MIMGNLHSVISSVFCKLCFDTDSRQRHIPLPTATPQEEVTSAFYGLASEFRGRLVPLERLNVMLQTLFQKQGKIMAPLPTCAQPCCLLYLASSTVLQV